MLAPVSARPSFWTSGAGLDVGVLTTGAASVVVVVVVSDDGGASVVVVVSGGASVVVVVVSGGATHAFTSRVFSNDQPFWPDLSSPATTFTVKLWSTLPGTSN